MKLFLDSSAFSKRFVYEPGSQHVERLCLQADELGLSVICVPEIVSALNRRLREWHLTRQEYAHAKRCMALDVRDADIVILTPDVVQLSVGVLERHPLRAMDAIHVACALAWEADLFSSSDLRQVTAAKAAGLRTEQV